MENEEFIREFLEESEENLDQLDQDFVSLEQDPRDHARLDSIYRAIHTIKGTSGFFGFSKLGAVAHAAENMLSHLRDGEITLNEGLASALLDSVDAIRDILSNIAKAADEGDGDYRELQQKLEDLCASALGTEPVTDVNERCKVDVPADDAETHGSNDSAGNFGRRSHDDGEGRQAEHSSAMDVEPAFGISDELANHITGNTKPSESTTPDIEDFTGDPEAAVSPDVGKSQIMASEGSIRVDVGLLNNLMDLVGELVLARNQLVQTERSERVSRLTDVTQQVNRITTELQERVMQTRMQPIGNIWGKFPRLVRDLAVICGKEVELAMEGSDTEVDKSLLEAIKDPLIHLIRNAIDHGIERVEERISCGKEKKGALHLRAWHQGGKVNIEISDNGKGIDPEVIRGKAIAKGLITARDAQKMNSQQLIHLIFCPGFSTAPEVTGISGRGVGMDVVKTNIERIGGTIEVRSRIGIGTTIKVKIPLTLAILPALVISINEQVFAIPQSHVVEMLRVDMNDVHNRIEHVRETPVYRLRGELLPIVYLSELLGVESYGAESQYLNIVVLQAEKCRFGLVVDTVERMEEIVVKPLHPSLGVIPHLAGATVMGDGSLALILDIVGLAANLGISLEEDKPGNVFVNLPAAREPDNQMLLFRLTTGRELAVPLSEVDRLEDFPVAHLERSDRRLAVQYRGQIMPLLHLSLFLEEAAEENEARQYSDWGEGTSVKAIVIKCNGGHAAIAVREILDIAEQEGPMRRTTTPGSVVGGAAVIQGKVTDVLDLQSVLQRSGFARHSYSSVTT